MKNLFILLVAVLLSIGVGQSTQLIKVRTRSKSYHKLNYCGMISPYVFSLSSGSHNESSNVYYPITIERVIFEGIIFKVESVSPEEIVLEKMGEL